MKPIKIDSHCHTEYSFDCDVSVETQAKAAITAGVSILTITDHAEFDRFEDDASLLPALLRGHDEVRREAGLDFTREAGLELLCGVEIGQAMVNPAGAEAVIAARPYDSVLCSLHSLQSLARYDVPYGDLYYVNFRCVSEPCVYDLLREYYSELLKLALSTDYDILTHLTYPSRYVYKSTGIHTRFEMLKRDIIPILETVVSRGKTLEVNTNEINKDYGKLVPDEIILEWYKKLGGENVSVGADAHIPEYVGEGIEHAYATLRRLGFSEVSYYKRRERKSIAI